MFRFLKTTVQGGILFLVPVIIFIMVIGKAVKLTDKLAAPIARMLPFEVIGGVAVAELIAVMLLVLMCFIAGLAAKTAAARRIVQSLEDNVLDKVPAYALMKAKTDSVLSAEATEDLQPVLIQFDDSSQIGLLVESLDNGTNLVFLPGAPDPWSGAICGVTSDRITSLPISVREVTQLMKRLGKGSTDTVRAALAREAS